MTKKEIYVANDGKEFDNEEECLFYENNTADIKKYASFIQNYCGEHECEECVFYDKSYEDCAIKNFSPCNWEI